MVSSGTPTSARREASKGPLSSSGTPDEKPRSAVTSTRRDWKTSRRNALYNTQLMKPGALIADRFEVDRRAGAGGMCVVYRARDRETATTFALKVLARGEGRVLERFDREARVLADLRHPSI